MQDRPYFIYFFILFFSVALSACHSNTSSEEKEAQRIADSLRADSVERAKKEEYERTRPREANDIQIEKELTYDEYTLEDEYDYEDTVRFFQWDKIKEKLAFVENFQRSSKTYAVIQNYRNMNQEAPLVKNFHRNEYKLVSDSLGVERYQSVPLYVPGDDSAPILYGRDGSLVELKSADTVDMVKLEGISFEGEWEVPKRYVKKIGESDSIKFHHVVIVDVTHQNIVTLERAEDDKWLVRSMNPATSGHHNPPYAKETPVGMFVVQEQKPKMFYLKDGTSDIAGFAPYASRFTNGGYLHGVPVNYPRKSIIEYSPSLGTTPRSHMCVRNASSHAKFMYDWLDPLKSLVIVID